MGEPISEILEELEKAGFLADYAKIAQRLPKAAMDAGEGSPYVSAASSRMSVCYLQLFYVSLIVLLHIELNIQWR